MHMAMVVICAVLTVLCEIEFMLVESKPCFFGLSTDFSECSPKNRAEGGYSTPSNSGSSSLTFGEGWALR